MYFRNKKSNQDKEVVMPKKKSETKKVTIQISLLETKHTSTVTTVNTFNRQIAIKLKSSLSTSKVVIYCPLIHYLYLPHKVHLKSRLFKFYEIRLP